MYLNNGRRVVLVCVYGDEFTMEFIKCIIIQA